MRIISGSHRGKRIVAPKKLPVRPTTDMAKEALFNILHNSYFFEDVSVLDLYAGTGNISFEFASRGSRDITAVDVNPHCVRFIQKTAEALNFPISAVRSNVPDYLSRSQEKFDIIFADPPYNQAPGESGVLIDLIFGRELLENDGILVIEHSKYNDLSMHANFEYSRKYGNSVFSFFT